MSFIQENSITLNLGISKKYHLIQFSDIHLVTYNEYDSLESIEKAKNHEAVWMKQRLDFSRKFGEKYDANFLLPSTSCLDVLISYCNSSHPDLVLLTGDIVDYYSETNFVYLKQSLMKLKNPFLFTRGNHETPITFFNELCNGNSEIDYLDFDEFLIVSIDNSSRKINSNQIETFKKLISFKKPMILAMHIPIMTEYNELEFSILDSYYSMKYNDSDILTRELIHLVCLYDEVKAILCGHTHGAITSLIAPNKREYCCSSGLIGSVNKITIK